MVFGLTVACLWVLAGVMSSLDMGIAAIPLPLSEYTGMALIPYHTSPFLHIKKKGSSIF